MLPVNSSVATSWSVAVAVLDRCFNMNNTHPIITIDLVSGLLPIKFSSWMNGTDSGSSFGQGSPASNLTLDSVPPPLRHNQATNFWGLRCYNGVSLQFWLEFYVKDCPKPGVADPEMEQLIAERVDTFWKGIEGGANKRGQVSPTLSAFNLYWKSWNVQIVVTFSEKRPKKSWFQVYMGEEDVPWEQWYAKLASILNNWIPDNSVGSSMLKCGNQNQNEVCRLCNLQCVAFALNPHRLETAMHLTQHWHPRFPSHYIRCSRILRLNGDARPYHWLRMPPGYRHSLWR